MTIRETNLMKWSSSLRRGVFRKHPNKVVTSKYNAATFIPLNILHQLSKPSTLFFCITAILLFIPTISPFGPISYFVAFLVVIGVSIVKDGIEDYNRHVNDAEINNKSCCILVIEGNEVVVGEKKVMDIERGDWLYLKEDDEVQADVVLVKSVLFYDHKKKSKRARRWSKTDQTDGGGFGKCENFCFIDTRNLDGESNLKKKFGMEFQSEGCDDLMSADNICPCLKSIVSRDLSIDLKDTGDSLNDFNCDITVNERTCSATKRNVILRGSIIKNIDRAICLVLAVGADTKQSIGTSKTRKKKSRFEEKMDFLLFLVGILYAIILLATTIFGGIMIFWNENTRFILGRRSVKDLIYLFFSNYVIYSYLVPLSLFVTVEVARFFHAQYISNDTALRSSNLKSFCNNSNVVEDLGIIEYILTDKTGTITKNSLTLREVHIGGSSRVSKLTEFYDLLKSRKKWNNPGIIELIVLNLLTCNSIEVMNGRYQGISQDELSFLRSLKRQGYELIERDEGYVVVRVARNTERVQILAITEFTSKEQFMSCLVEYKNRYFLFIKGSDNRLLDEFKEKNIIEILNNVGDFRSLVLRYKELSQEESVEFLEKKDNTEYLRRTIEESIYLGSTFIEDELQDGVSETMDALHRAGIKIWMITGDKQETAISCARKSGIIGNLPYLAIEGSRFATLVEEDAADSINDPNFAEIFDTNTLIIFRATPSQKGLIASALAKRNKNTLAIGDGNNDVAMLKIAHVGVGILGKEGTQASFVADIAIPKFKLLKNLILVHGRYNLIRYSKISLNAFYKNIMFILIQFFYNFSNCASGRPIYNELFMNYYNLLFTSLIPFAIVLFDRDIPRTSARSNPVSYSIAKANFSRPLIGVYIGYAVLQSIAIYLLLYGLLKMDICNLNGIVGGYGCTSTIFSIVVFFAVIIRQYKQISFLVTLSKLALYTSCFFMILLIFGVQNLLSTSNSVIYILLSMPATYFVIIPCLCLVMIGDTIFDVISESLVKKQCDSSTDFDE